MRSFRISMRTVFQMFHEEKCSTAASNNIINEQCFVWRRSKKERYATVYGSSQNKTTPPSPWSPRWRFHHQILLMLLVTRLARARVVVSSRNRRDYNGLAGNLFCRLHVFVVCEQIWDFIGRLRTARAHTGFWLGAGDRAVLVPATSVTYSHGGLSAVCNTVQIKRNGALHHAWLLLNWMDWSRGDEEDAAVVVVLRLGDRQSGTATGNRQGWGEWWRRGNRTAGSGEHLRAASGSRQGRGWGGSGGGDGSRRRVSTGCFLLNTAWQMPHQALPNLFWEVELGWGTQKSTDFLGAFCIASPVFGVEIPIFYCLDQSLLSLDGFQVTHGHF